MMALRFSFSAALLIPFVAMPRGKMKEVATLSVTLGAAHFSMMFTGLKTIDASTAAIAIQLQVPFSALLATLLLADPPGWRRVVGDRLLTGIRQILAVYRTRVVFLGCQLGWTRFAPLTAMSTIPARPDWNTTRRCSSEVEL